MPLFADGIRLLEPAFKLLIHIRQRGEAKVVDVVSRRNRIDAPEPWMLQPASKNDVAIQPLRSRVTCANDIRVWNAMRVFSGSTITGPQRWIMLTTASKRMRISAGLPSKCVSRSYRPQKCDWFRLANRRSQSGHCHRDRNEREVMEGGFRRRASARNTTLRILIVAITGTRLWYHYLGQILVGTDNQVRRIARN